MAAARAVAVAVVCLVGSETNVYIYVLIINTYYIIPTAKYLIPNT